VTFRFGDFVLDVDRYELRRGEERVAAEPQVLELLAHLLRHRDRVVSKEELLAEVWEGRIVSDSALSRTVREVRRLLGDSAAESRFVRTVYGRGFRFVGEGVLEKKSVAGGAAGDDGREGSDAKAAGPAGMGASTPLTARPLPTPLTPLLGREQELAEAVELLDSTRLLTLTGAAGTGKSRLAISLAAERAERFADGAAFVPLAEVTEPAAVASAVARALGLTDAAGESTVEALCLQLHERQLLLVLDNFEQVVSAAAGVEEMLRSCPTVTAIVTSRFVLRVEGEQEYAVPPLMLPAREAGAEAIREAPAVAFFLARARATLPSFSPDELELSYVAEICRRLDGLPLALELAASQVKVFPPKPLWERLAARFDLLSRPARQLGRPHRSLEQALDWSYELLDSRERTALRRLAVFSGSFELPAAEAVCDSGEKDTSRLIGALIDKSLVERQAPRVAETRFRMLETTRAFALDRLREAGEEAEVRQEHALWYAEIARRGAAALTGGDQERWLQHLDADHPNLVAVMEWSRAGGDLATGIAIGAALGRYWSARGAYREGTRKLEALLTHPDAAGVPATIRIDGLIALGSLTHLMCDYHAASERLEEARRLLAEIEDASRLAEVLNHLAWIAVQIDPLDEAEAVAREALAANESVGDARGVAVALNNLGQSAFYRGEASTAEECFVQSLARRREAGDDRGVVFALANLAMARHFLGGDLEPIDGWLKEARSRLGTLGDALLEAWVADLEARTELARGRPEEALARLQKSLFGGVEMAHPDGTAWLLLSIGDAHQAIDELELARQEIEKAEQIWDSIGSHWGRAAAGLRLARLAALEDRAEEALGRYREVAELCDRFGLTGPGAAAREAAAELASTHRD
jgi:predicted ATPase/DNA-binding winged helix-turn-helix (wHTH) protein